MLTTRTSSPYFSPNSARAPLALASSMPITRVTTGSFCSTIRLAISSTSASSSAVMGLAWETSKRRRSPSTSEPFWAMCGPSTWRSASCSRWVAEWLARIARRRAPSTSATSAAPTATPPSTTSTSWTTTSPSFLPVSVTRRLVPGAVSVPVSPTWPPDSP